MSLDQSDYMTTYSGHRLYFAAPDPDAIHIEDIAHALSQLCRFTGHTRFFYSVAEHSEWASWYVPDEHALEALLHDAHEAYVNDLARPLKLATTGYREIADRIDAVIRVKFNLPPTLTPDVKRVDNLLVVAEARQLMRDTEWNKGMPSIPLPRLELRDHVTIKATFLNRFDNLTASL